MHVSCYEYLGHPFPYLIDYVLTRNVVQLCASGTVAVAAIGFAFGHPQRLNSTRPVTAGRKSILHGGPDESRIIPTDSPTPSPLPSSSSTSRLHKKSSLNQTISPSNRFSGGAYSRASTPGGRLLDESDCTDPGSSQALKRSTSPGPVASDYKGTGTAKSSWLRRMSTLSSLKTGSHDSTPPPGSPSLSYSNGSTALILPSTAQGQLSSQRNKLVKRSSSQKILQGNITPHSTLRRPATSHQRTATLKQRYSSGEDLNYRSQLASPLPFEDLQEDHQAYDESLQVWVPFFTSHAPATIKDGSTRKRNVNVGTSRKEPAGSMSPDVHGLPTLLLATSITLGSPEHVPDAVISRPKRSDIRRPSTAIGFESFIPPSSSGAEIDLNNQQDLKSRPSFSISDMFPSPSASRWKIPRASSLKRNKGPSNVVNGRRVSSAPFAVNAINSSPSPSAEADALITSTRTTGTMGRRRDSPPIKMSNSSEGLDELSSPLPPLNRLSTFNIDLPTTAPSYPASPQPEPSPASLKISSTSSPFSSPPGPAMARNKSHRPSGTQSDRASTLLGSDNEISRFLSSDEDDYDFRSETVYSSTRTGATGSSHSGVRRPPIETIFDESPPAELPKHKLIALQDLISSQSFAESDAHRRRNAEAQQSLSTPVRATAPCKDDEYPTPIHTANRPPLADLPSSPPDIPLEVRSNRSFSQVMDDFPDDEEWSVDNVDDSNPTLSRYDLTAENDPPTPLGRSPRFSYGLPDAAVAGGDSVPKSNIFEWSEQSLTERESMQGSSPRPKTVHGIKANDTRGSRLSGRRGSSALHLRSQSVPVPPDGSGHRSHNNTSKLESWVLGNKGVSEDWDGDFDFEETHRPIKQTTPGVDGIRSSSSSGMLVPRAILERQASVHGQFGQVKELTLLVEELKRLRQQANAQGILHGQAAELWKEAEGIINLATLDDEEQSFFPPRSPPANGFEFDGFDEDSPSSHGRRKPGSPSPREERLANTNDSPAPQALADPSPDKSKQNTLPTSRPRKESVAKAKSVLETIHQQRSEYNSTFTDAKSSQKKLPFDTTSLRDLVTRAGVVTRALKEIVRRSEAASPTPKARPCTPPDPLFSQIFQQPPSPSINKSSRLAQSPKSNNSRGGAIANNDNEINGHMKMMTVV